MHPVLVRGNTCAAWPIGGRLYGQGSVDLKKILPEHTTQSRAQHRRVWIAFAGLTFDIERFRTMKTKILTLMASFAVASVVLMGPRQEAPRAADEWFVLSQQALNPASPSVEIKSEGGRWEKDVKKIKFSVEGGDVEVTSAVLHWDNRPDDTIAVGTMKAGGESAPADAPLRKARLKGVTVQQ